MLDIFSVSVVVIRTVAFLMITGALPAIPATWAAIKYATNPVQGYDPVNTAIIIGAVTHLLLAFLLLIYAKQLARFMTKGLENTNAPLNEPKLASLQAVAFSILGVYVLLYSIPTLIKIIVIELLRLIATQAKAHLSRQPKRQTFRLKRSWNTWFRRHSAYGWFWGPGESLHGCNAFG
jgi:hypothetical protein